MASVMIVDDALFMRRMLRDILESADFEVIGEAENGEAAVEMFERLRPTLVTMDVVMPHLNGVEATRKILELEPQTRVVMVSAMGQESMILEAMEAGASDYIVKPFRKEEVVETLRRVAVQE